MGVSELDDILKHAPADENEALMRSAFLAQALNNICRRQLDTVLNCCDVGQYGEAAAEAVQGGIAETNFQSATKILTCISLHMLGLDRCTESGVAWLVQFMFEAVKEADEHLPSPAAAEIIAKHGSWKRDTMVQDVAAEVCTVLELPTDNSGPVTSVADFLAGSAQLRDELLLFALSQPPQALRHHLEVFA